MSVVTFNDECPKCRLRHVMRRPVQVHVADSASYWWLTEKGVEALEGGDWSLGS
jgi:hypothetical protein